MKEENLKVLTDTILSGSKVSCDDLILSAWLRSDDHAFSLYGRYFTTSSFG